MSPLTFASPVWLWALVLTVPTYWAWRSILHRPGVPRAQRHVAWLRPMCLSLLVLALAGAQWSRPHTGVDLLFLVDRSLSMTSEAQEAGAALWSAAHDVRRPGDRLGLVVFGSDTLIEQAIGEAPRSEPAAIRALPESAETDLESALQVGLSLRRPGAAMRIVVVSDGVQTRGDALLLIPALQEARVPVDAFPVREPPEAEVIAEAIVASDTATPGEPLDVRVIIASTVEQEAMLYLLQDDRIISDVAVELEAGRNLVDLSGLRLTADRSVRLEARVVPQTDTFDENNAVHAVVKAGGPARVLLVRDDGGGPLHQALADQGIAVDLTTPAEVPAAVAQLVDYGAVVFDDVSAFPFSEAQLTAVAQYVREAGGGFVIAGGTNSFHFGGYADSALEPLMPIGLEVPQDVAIPTLAMLMVIDKSGSMAESNAGATKLDLAKEAVLGTLQFLSPMDIVGVLAFDGQPRWVVQPTHASQTGAIAREVSSLQADGGTNLFPALVQAEETLAQTEALAKHVIVLSDGHSAGGDFAALARRMADSGMTISTVAVGTGADRDLLAGIARDGGGRYYFTEDIHRVPRIFAAETFAVTQPQFIDEPFVPMESRQAEFLRGLPSPWPMLHGTLLTTPKPAADVHIVGPGETPILATWRIGLGRVAAFTSSIGQPWGIAWLEWPGFTPFWTQLVRWVLRTQEAGILDGTLQIEGGTGTIVVDAVDESGAFKNFVDLQAQVAGPGGRGMSLPLRQTGPGRYEAQFPATQRGAWLVTVREDGATGAALTMSDVVSYSPEYRLLDPDTHLLSQLAAETGGIVLDGPDDLEQLLVHPFPPRRPYPLWPSLAAFALIVFLIDVGLRYTSAEAMRHALSRAKGWITRIRPAAESGQTLDELVDAARAERSRPHARDSDPRTVRRAYTYLAKRKKGRNDDA